MAREKQKRRQYTADYKRQAIEQMRVADSIVQLAEKLEVPRGLLYQWEAAAEGRGRKTKGQRRRREVPEGTSRETALEGEVTWLREALAKKVQEADFFKGALHKVEERRRSNANCGGTASTTRSEN